MSAGNAAGERHDDDAGMPDRPVNLPQEFVQITRIRERGKTLRTFFVCATIILGIGMVVYGLMQIVAEPKWWQVGGAIVLALIAPGGVIRVLLKSRKKYVEKTHRRTAELEQGIDGERSSSSEKDKE